MDQMCDACIRAQRLGPVMEAQALVPYSAPPLGVSSVVTVKLAESTYLLWKFQFETYLSGQGLLGFVNGAIPQPLQFIQVPDINGQSTEVPNPDYHSWYKTDHVVKSWLIGSFSEEVLAIVISCATSQDIWLTVANHFNKISPARLYDLQCRLQVVAKRGRPTTEFLNEITSICTLLQSVGYAVTEQVKIFTALKGLGQEYEGVKASIEGSMESVPPITFSSIIPRLLSAEARVQSYSTGTEVSPHLAFYTVPTNSSGRGHTYNRGRARGRTFSTRGRGFPQQLGSIRGQTLQSDTEPKKLCQICGKKGHVALSCWHRFDNAYQEDEFPRAMAAMRITDISDHNGHEWFPDTGASAHVTNSTSHLQQSQPYMGSDAVMVADGNFLPITHTGSAVITSSTGQGHQASSSVGQKQ